MWSWGSGEYGATGLGDLEVKTVPWIIQTGIAGRAVSASTWRVLGRISSAGVDLTVCAGWTMMCGCRGAVACGSRHSLVLTDTGRLFAFGSGSYGQLGLGNLHSQTVPTPVAFSPPSRPKHTVVVTSICAGFRHRYDAASWSNCERVRPDVVVCGGGFLCLPSAFGDCIDNSLAEPCVSMSDCVGVCV